MSLGKKFMIWTADDDEKLSEIVASAGVARGTQSEVWSEIATHFEGRSWLACKQHWHLLQRIASGKIPNPHVRIRRTHQEIVATRQQPQIPPPAPLYVPLQVAVAIILGEPAAGRSHLDKIRRGEVAPPPLMDGQPSRFLHKGVTLAQGVGEA